MKSRLPLLVVGWCLIVAPTPGSVGSCGKDDLDDPADFRSYCEQREELACTRQYLRKEITAEKRDECRWDGIDACSRSAFPSDCRPTRRATRACLNALSDLDHVKTKEQDIPECKKSALCTATPSEQRDAGGEAGIENPDQ